MNSYGPFSCDHLNRDTMRSGIDLTAVRSRYNANPDASGSQRHAGGLTHTISALLGRFLG